MKIKLISILIPYYQKNNQLYLWVQKRESQDELNGLLEFPGGKIEGIETSQEAAVRETFEEAEIKVDLDQVERLGSFEFDKGLTIFVHLYEDQHGQFDNRGYYQVDKLLELKDKILPNNVSLLGQVKRYFEEFKC